jgi:hypothetical protein
VAFLEGEVGEGGAKVAPQGRHGLGLRVPVLLDDLERPAQDGAALLRMEDGDEVPEDPLALPLALLAREFFRHADSLPDVAQFVEEAALFGSLEMLGPRLSATLPAARRPGPGQL